MNKLKLNNQSKKIVAILFLALLVVILTSYFIFRPKIVFLNKQPTVEINSTYDPITNIKLVRGGTVDDVTCNLEEVDYTKLGSYPIVYSYNNKTYPLNLTVVDTTPPTFDVKDLEIDAGMDVEANQFVENISDATTTISSFKEKYNFSKEGELTVTIIVEDESKNKTEKKAKIKILPKDQTPPTVEEFQDITILKDGNLDPNSGISFSDNQDPNPTIECNLDQLDLSKVGDYQINYTIKDRSGNEKKFNRTVHVKPRVNIGSGEQSSKKVVYLTFDDGPSENTGKILEILDHYDAKATFFVTGNGQSHNHFIKEAHDKGHTIGLHTYTHRYNELYASTEAYFNDLTKIGDMVKGIIGESPKYIRFPGGSSNTVSKKYSPGIMTTLSKEVIDRGYQYYDWNVTSADANGNTVPTDQIVQSAIKGKSNNLIILFHDSKPKTTTVEALPQIIEHYKNAGYVFEGINDGSYYCHHGINN